MIAEPYTPSYPRPWYSGGGRGWGPCTIWPPLRILPCFLLLVLWACASTPPQPAALSQPAQMTFDSDLMMTPPPAVVVASGIPRLKGHISASIKAQQIRIDPPRSSYSGTLHVNLENPDTGQLYLNFTTKLDGQIDGIPNDAVSACLDQASRLFNALNTAGLTGAATKPSQMFSNVQMDGILSNSTQLPLLPGLISSMQIHAIMDSATEPSTRP